VKLETFGKIGIMSGIIVAGLVAADITLMVLDQFFDISFRQYERNLSEQDKKDALNMIKNSPEYMLFKEKYPNSNDRFDAYQQRVELEVSQYHPETENALVLKIELEPYWYYNDVQAYCDVVDRDNYDGMRLDSRGGMVIDFIKNTKCLDNLQ